MAGPGQCTEVVNDRTIPLHVLQLLLSPGEGYPPHHEGRVSKNKSTSWHVCASEAGLLPCQLAVRHPTRWAAVQAAKRPCISIKCVCRGQDP